MTIHFKDQYATFWKISSYSDKNGEKRAEIDITTSEKDKTTGKYENTRWFPEVRGVENVNKIQSLKPGDRITIAGKFERKKGKNNNIYYTNMIIYGVDLGTTVTTSATPEDNDDEEDEELIPF